MEQKKVIISQPMSGRTDEEIAVQRERAIRDLEAKAYGLDIFYEE